MNLSQILIRDDFRIDAFYKTVCQRVILSEGMKKRAKKILGLPHLDVYLCSNEDIFVFKTFTEREGDLQDCIALAQQGLDWKTIVNEVQAQIQQSGEDIWITWIGERLDVLVERGLNIPIMNQIDMIRDTYSEKLEKTLKQKKTKKQQKTSKK